MGLFSEFRPGAGPFFKAGDAPLEDAQHLLADGVVLALVFRLDGVKALVQCVVLTLILGLRSAG